MSSLLLYSRRRNYDPHGDECNDILSCVKLPVIPYESSEDRLYLQQQFPLTFLHLLRLRFFLLLFTSLICFFLCWSVVACVTQVGLITGCDLSDCIHTSNAAHDILLNLVPLVGLEPASSHLRGRTTSH